MRHLVAQWQKLSDPDVKGALDRIKDLPTHIRGEHFNSLMREHNIIPHTKNPQMEAWTHGFYIEPTHESMTSIDSHEKLHTGQTHLYKPALEEYIRNGHEGMTDPDYESEDSDETSAYHPEVFHHQEKNWIAEGHHRILAHRMTNRGDVDVWHTDVDMQNPRGYADKIEYPEA